MPNGVPGATSRSPKLLNLKVLGRFVSVMRPPPSYGDNWVVSPMRNEFAGSSFSGRKGNGAQSFKPLTA